MRAEEILREPQRIQRRIGAISAEIVQVRASLLPGGINYEMDRIQGGTSSDRYADVMAKIDELERKARQLEARYEALQRRVLPELLAAVEDPEAEDIIRLHDVMGISMGAVSEIMHRSRSGLYDIRKTGIDSIQQSLDTMDGKGVL